MATAQPPRPADPRQQRIEEYLEHLVSPGARQFYSDGRRLAAGEFALDTASHVLHQCARELESGVREVLVEVLRATSAEHVCGFDEEDVSHADQIRAIVRAVGLRDDVARGWIAIVTGKGYEADHLAGESHRRGLERARRLNDDARRRWRDFELLLLVLLPELERRFVIVLDALRELAAITAPTDLDRRRFLRLPATYVAREDFFARASPGWLARLDAKDLFDHPEDGWTRDLVSGELVPQHSPALTYLARMASDATCQSDFVRIATRIEMPHENAAFELVKGAAALPLELRVRYSEHLADWVRKQDRLWLAADEITSFAIGLFADRAIAPAIALLEALLRLHPDPNMNQPRASTEELFYRPTPASPLDDYEYERALTRAMPAMSTADPERALDFALGLLVRSIEFSERPERAARHSDSSKTWRPSIASGGHHYGHDRANALTDAVRDAAVACARTSPAARDHALKKLEATGWTLCRRIALYVLTEVPK